MYFKQFLSIDEINHNGKIYYHVYLTKENRNKLIEDIKVNSPELYKLITECNLDVYLHINDDYTYNSIINVIKYDEQHLILVDNLKIKLVINDSFILANYFDILSYNINKNFQYNNITINSNDYLLVSKNNEKIISNNWENHNNIVRFYDRHKNSIMIDLNSKNFNIKKLSNEELTIELLKE